MFAKVIGKSGLIITFEPPTNAASDSPDRILWHARCNATKLVEHPVSTVKLGPLRSKKYDIRLDSMAVPVPVT